MNRLLVEHFKYLSDPAKLRAYGEATAAVVRDGDVVLDIGCGSGVLGLLCLRAGARHVHAIDETPFIEVARRTMAQAGFEARATFYRSRAQHVELPERVDVVVCDHVGYFGIDYGVLDMLADARRRFLKPVGTIIPAELQLSIAAIESESCRAFVGDWRGDQVPSDFHWVADLAADTKHPVMLRPGDLLSTPVKLATVRPGVDAQPFFSWTTMLAVARDGRLDGVAGWFDCRLAADVWMTNDPRDSGRLRRSQVFLPLAEPVSVREGESIRVTVMSRPGDRILGWVVELPESGRRFTHSTWNAMLLNRQDLP